MRMTSSDERERYNQIMSKWPQLFENPPDARYEILRDSSMVAEAESEERSRLLARRLPVSWSRIGVVYEDPYLIVLRDAVRRPDGSLGTYARTLPASGAAGAAVLPLLDGKIVLLRRFRHATRKWHLEIPRGFDGGRERSPAGPAGTARGDRSRGQQPHPSRQVPH